jgi:hypothetical protein
VDVAKKIVHGTHAEEKFENFEEAWLHSNEKAGQRDLAEARKD